MFSVEVVVRDVLAVFILCYVGPTRQLRQVRTLVRSNYLTVPGFDFAERGGTIVDSDLADLAAGWPMSPAPISAMSSVEFAGAGSSDDCASGDSAANVAIGRSAEVLNWSD